MPRISSQPGASVEVLAHQWALHLQDCPDANDVVAVECPCGCGAVQICRRCYRPVFVALFTDDPPCSHLARFFDGVQ
jgi:hypothetical protein